jgi:hypothetical protein
MKVYEEACRANPMLDARCPMHYIYLGFRRLHKHHDFQSQLVWLYLYVDIGGYVIELV